MHQLAQHLGQLEALLPAGCAMFLPVPLRLIRDDLAAVAVEGAGQVIDELGNVIPHLCQGQGISRDGRVFAHLVEPFVDDVVALRVKALGQATVDAVGMGLGF